MITKVGKSSASGLSRTLFKQKIPDTDLI